MEIIFLRLLLVLVLVVFKRVIICVCSCVVLSCSFETFSMACLPMGMGDFVSLPTLLYLIILYE